MKMKYLGLLGMILWSLSSVAHNQSDSLTRKEIRKSRPEYTLLEVGMGTSNFTDFATSPLSYSGPLVVAGFGHLRCDQKRAYSTLLSFTAGANISTQGVLSQSTVMTFQATHSQLFQIPQLSRGQNNFMLGGKLDLFGDFRINQSLMNHTLGNEYFANISLASKFSRDISIATDIKKKFFFIPYTKKAKQQNINLKFNIGLWNNHFRNGFNYIGNSSLINDPRVFDNHEMSYFSGAHLSGEFYYQKYQKNNNIIRYSYSMQAFKTKGDEPFQIALHTFKVSLLILQNPKKEVAL
jgi:hypothetical protein